MQTTAGERCGVRERLCLAAATCHPLLKERYGVRRSERIAQNFKCLTTFSAYVCQTSMVQSAGRGFVTGTIAMGDLIFVLSIFAVGAGCGYYLRDLVSKERRERYQKSKQSKRARNSIGSYLRGAGR